MTEEASEPRLGRFPGMDPAFLARRAMQAWKLTVTEAFNVAARMRRVRFTGDDLREMEWRPGQDLVLNLPQPGGSIARRHYTIRKLDGAVLDIDFVLHGDSPATRWARDAVSGATIEAHGPRGRTHVRADAKHHWFVGDESCLPGIFAMAERLPLSARGTVLLEIEDDTDKQVLNAPPGVELHWVQRNGEHRGPSSLLLDQLKIRAPDPDGAHAYLIGETSNVRAQRHYLVERGFTREQITAEGYWRPGRVGGHDHV